MEVVGSKSQTVECAVREIISQFDDPEREGLKDTPARVAKMYSELFDQTDFALTTFDANGYDQLIVERDIPFYSLCEHHLVPFFGVAHIGYIPNEKIVGISKLARTVEMFARRLQVQERMTQQIANHLTNALNPIGLGVVIQARHLCQEMRGIKKSNVETVTSVMLGALLEMSSARSEFLSLCTGGHR
jgi:GTP cyclohydrolase IA